MTEKEPLLFILINLSYLRSLRELAEFATFLFYLFSKFILPRASAVYLVWLNSTELELVFDPAELAEQAAYLVW